MSKLCKMNCKKKDLKDIMKLVKNPKFVCENCFRAANDEEYLHYPVKIKNFKKKHKKDKESPEDTEKLD